MLSNARRILYFLLFLPGLNVYADVTLFIEAPLAFLGHVSSTGHAALLIRDLCSDDHIHLRRCRADEDGTVVSRYKGINGYDWLAMPPGPYLFAVDSSDEVPESTSVVEVNHLRAEYRMDHPGTFEHDPSGDGWVQLIGASQRRRIICNHLRTTAVQDERETRSPHLACETQSHFRAVVSRPDLFETLRFGYICHHSVELPQSFQC